MNARDINFGKVAGTIDLPEPDAVSDEQILDEIRRWRDFKRCNISGGIIRRVAQMPVITTPTILKVDELVKDTPLEKEPFLHKVGTFLSSLFTSRKDYDDSNYKKGL